MIINKEMDGGDLLIVREMWHLNFPMFISNVADFLTCAFKLVKSEKFWEIGIPFERDIFMKLYPFSLITVKGPGQ